MSLVPGINWIFYKYEGGTWKPYVCARSGNFSLGTSFIETTAPGAGDFRTFEPEAHDFTAQIDGLVSLNETGNITADELLASQIAKEKMLCRFMQTSVNGDTFIKQAYFYISSYTDTGSFDGVSSFSVSLRGTGLLSINNTPPPTPTPGDMRYPIMGDTAPYTPWGYSWPTPGLTPTNTELTNVVKDGRGSNNIILTGTPVGNEVLFEEDPSNPGDGLLTWAVPFEEVETPPYITYSEK